MGKSAFPVQWIADFPNMWEDCTRSVEWRSGSAGALQAQGRGFKSLLDHQKQTGSPLWGPCLSKGHRLI